MGRQLYIGTSGWHYTDWLGAFYPPEITGYRELTFHAKHFNTVENNSSFYRIAGQVKTQASAVKFCLSTSRCTRRIVNGGL